MVLVLMTSFIILKIGVTWVLSHKNPVQFSGLFSKSDHMLSWPYHSN